MSNRFARIGETFDQYKERRKVETTLSYERKVVKKILTGLGLDPVSLAVAKQEVDPEEPEAYATISWLGGTYPSFPVMLQTRETWVPDVRDFFKVRSRKNSFWAVWEDLTDCLQGNRKPIGCVFPFPQVTDMGHGVIHNANLPHTGYDPEREFIFMQRISPKETITLELLDSFINRLRTIWEPS
jgi:hypothetical protein